MQGKYRDTDIENEHVDTAEEGEGGRTWDTGIDICVLPCVKHTASGNLLETCRIAQGAQLSALWRPRGEGRVGGREVQEGRDICIHTADLPHCTLETNTTL